MLLLFGEATSTRGERLAVAVTRDGRAQGTDNAGSAQAEVAPGMGEGLGEDVFRRCRGASI